MSTNDDRFYGLIPLPDGRGMVTFQVPRPLRADEWDFLSRVLSTMRPGLVEPETQLPDEFTMQSQCRGVPHRHEARPVERTATRQET